MIWSEQVGNASAYPLPLTVGVKCATEFRNYKLFIKLAAIQKSFTSEPGHWSGGIPGSCLVPPQAAELYYSAGWRDRTTHDQLEGNQVQTPFPEQEINRF